MSDGQAVLMDDSDNPDAAQSIFYFSSRSMNSSPLMGPLSHPLGIVYVDTDDPAGRFVDDDLEILVTVATVAGQAVGYIDQQATASLRNGGLDLDTAKEMQLHFLPQSRPEVPGYQFYDYYLAAGNVGGDYFGYIPLPDGRLVLAIGDVAGKGVAAALARWRSSVPRCGIV